MATFLEDLDMFELRKGKAMDVCFCVCVGLRVCVGGKPSETRPD